MPQAARSYLAQLDPVDIQLAAIRARGGLSGYQVINGWHADPTRSGDAKLELANGFNLTFPDATGKPVLIGHMVDLYARLASAWNREKLTIETRGHHNKRDNAHIDFDAEYVSIANLTNISPSFAPPESYRGVQPLRYTSESGDLLWEYPMTKGMRQALENVPLESLASWRGTRDAAVHLVPEFEGPRIIMLTSTKPGTKPALV